MANILGVVDENAETQVVCILQKWNFHSIINL